MEMFGHIVYRYRKPLYGFDCEEWSVECRALSKEEKFKLVYDKLIEYLAWKESGIF